jgi:hypothetical protein
MIVVCTYQNRYSGSAIKMIVVLVLFVHRITDIQEVQLK